MEIRISFCSRGFNSTSTTWLFQSSGPTNLITANVGLVKVHSEGDAHCNQNERKHESVVPIFEID